MSEEENKYLVEYYKNEHDANKKIALALAFTAALLLVLWILYLIPGVFRLTEATKRVTVIAYPIFIVILLTPQIWVRREQGKKPGFKYFLLVTLLMVISLLNVLSPKHAIMGWAIAIVVSNHYYNPKVGKIVFAITLAMMLICIYLGMLFGEFDPNLLMGELDDKNGIIHSYLDPTLSFNDNPEGRLEYLRFLMTTGRNRFLTASLYYYFPRAIIVIIIFFSSNQLNKRTNNLFINEIRVNSEQEKMNTELEIAKEIQLATLPSNVITSEDVEIIGELKAAKEVGGDFYDYFRVGDEHIAILIGDVSGKGIPAAMFMMKTITCFKNFTRADKSPAEILKEVNASIFDTNNSQMFVTCFLAILNKKTGVLKYANAGHNPPIVGSNKNFRYLKCNNGFVLGGLKDAFVVDEEITLQPGECLTLYTDGITEARNIDGDFYGEERLIQTFNRVDYTCLVELHHTIKDDVATFVGDAPQSDDITFITLKFHGDHYSYEEKLFDATIENVSSMLSFVKEFCDEHKFQDSFSSNLQVVSDELFSNIVKYGYENKGGELFVRLLFNEDKKEFVLTVIDKAPAFNQLEVHNHEVNGDASHQKIGGLGILIVKKIMSEYAYDRINCKNILVLRKKF